jgi:hypothetical protein
MRLQGSMEDQSSFRTPWLLHHTHEGGILYVSPFPWLKLLNLIMEDLKRPKTILFSNQPIIVIIIHLFLVIIVIIVL